MNIKQSLTSLGIIAAAATTTACTELSSLHQTQDNSATSIGMSLLEDVALTSALGLGIALLTTGGYYLAQSIKEIIYAQKPGIQDPSGGRNAEELNDNDWLCSDDSCDHEESKNSTQKSEKDSLELPEITDIVGCMTSEAFYEE